MAAPNIFVASNMYGKTAGLLVTTTATAIVSNAAASGTVIKINALMVSNVNTTAAYSITTDVFNGTTAYRITPAIPIPTYSGIDILAKSIYLEEGQSLRLTASANSTLEAIVSYEVVS